MSRRSRLVAGLVTALSASACLPSASPAGAGQAGRAPHRATGGAGTVILGSDLWARGGSLLDALAGRVSSIRVSRRSGGGCPSVMMRGQRTVIGNPSAQVYVDGTPMLDTCILNQIRVLDVARVEVYGGGVSGGTGHRAGPNGTILVFLTGSEAAR